MYQGILKKPGGEVLIKFDIPSTLSELPLNRFVDFLVECRKMDEDADNVAEYTCRAVAAFTGFPIEKVIESQYETFSEPGLIDSVARIFGHALTLLSKSKGTLLTPESAVFQYKGEKYRIPVILQQAIEGETILPGLSTIEVIEVAEVHRFKKRITDSRADPDGKLRKRLQRLIEEQVRANGSSLDMTKQFEGFKTLELEKAGDPDGSLIYTTFLKSLAILARRDDERLPFNDSEREAWIQNRALHFSEIDAQTALNIDFFLTSILQNSENVTPVAGFLSRQSFAAVAATQLKNAKRSIGPLTSRKKHFGRSAGVK